MPPTRKLPENISEDYLAGLRDGRLESLERTVEQMAKELDLVRKALWMLYGAIALVGLLPKILELVQNGP